MINKTRLILLVSLLTLLAGALVFRTPAVLFLAATLAGAPVLAIGVGSWMSRGLRVTRQMPTVVSVGEEVRARLTVKNVGWIPALLVHAQGRGEPLPAKLPRRQRYTNGLVRAVSQILRARAPQSAPFETVGEGELVVPILMPGAQFEGEVAWKLTRRGVYAWPGASAGALDPVGIHLALPARSAVGELLVLPRPLVIERLQLGGGSPSAMPLHRAAAPADVAEIHGVRPYQPGEGGRRIHWRATARTGELHVIEWEEETASDMTLLLDVSARNIAGEAGFDTLEQTIVAAASVAAFLLENGQRARLVWWADDIVKSAQGQAETRLVSVEARHRAGLAQILTALAKIAPSQAPGATLAALSARVRGETQNAGALLLGSDRADWNEAMAVWKAAGARDAVHGLAFEAASFEPQQMSAGFTLRAGSAGAVTATMQRAGTSKQAPERDLPFQVRRVARTESLATILERSW